MYKKIFLSLIALIIFTLPIQHNYFTQKVEGAILSKAGSMAAKKAVKTVVKDAAIETGINYALNMSFQLDPSTRYKNKEGFKTICSVPVVAGECSKPVQIKEVLTEQDKINIGNQSEIEIDKTLTNGKGFTKWQKLLDWFVPIWLVSFGVTAITYLLDDETKSLFDEMAYNALVALGIIIPAIDTTNIVPISNVDVSDMETSPNGTTPTYSRQSTTRYINTTHVTFPQVPMPPQTLVETVYAMPIGGSVGLVKYEQKVGQAEGTAYALPTIDFTTNTVSIQKIVGSSELNGQAVEVTISKDGIPLETKGITSTNFSYDNFVFTHEEFSILKSKVQSIQTRLPYQIGDFWYTDMLFNSVDGNSLDLQVKATDNFTLTTLAGQQTYTTTKSTSITGATSTFYYDVPLFKEVQTPTYADIGTETIPSDNTKMIKDKKVAFVPIEGYPTVQTSTGETIKAVPMPDGSVTWQKEDGTTVPEDDVTVNDPNVSQDPTGQPQYTPNPTTQNPSPQPEPLTPSQTETPSPPPPSNQPPVETDPPIYPEGQSCDVGLKLPKISPLAYAVSESFPFSIPFDLYDGFQAIFSEMGNEKPEFNYKLNFMGEQQEWKITIPDYFDSWKRFTDSFLIFVFDVGIIFMIFRFMGGSK